MPFAGFLIFLLIFCGALLWVMYRVLGRHASQATDRLVVLTNEYEKKKEDLKKQAQENELKANKLLAEAQVEAERLKKQALDDAEQNREGLIKQAREEAERIVKDGVKAREAFRQELAAEMITKAVSTASRMVVEVLSPEARRKIHDLWVEELLDKGLASLDRFETKEKIEFVEIVTAFPLDLEQKNRIAEAVQKKLNEELPIRETIQENLVAGLSMILGHLVLEGTLSHKLKEAAHHAEHARP